MKKRVLSFVLALVITLAATAALGLAEPIFAFEHAEYDLNVKKTLTLQPVLQGADAPAKPKYAWESSDESVAKVKGGKITGVSAGDATITCRLTDENGATREASCVLHIKQPMTKLAPQAKVVLVRREKGFQLTPTILPENADNTALVYTSSDESVATVSESGYVTGKPGGGACTITMEAADGSKVKATQKVKVLPFVITVDEVTLSERATYRVKLDLSGTNYAFSPVFSYDKSKLELGGIHSDGYVTQLDSNSAVQCFTIRPIKAGTTSLKLTSYPYFWNPAANFTVKIKVEESACYSVKTFPKMNYAEAVGAPEERMGALMSVKGRYIGTVTDADGTLCYQVATKGGSEETVLLLAPAGSEKLIYKTGDSVTAYGSFGGVRATTTETGVQLYTPTLVCEKIDDLFLGGDNVIYLDFCK